jgi:hypothetical protein
LQQRLQEARWFIKNIQQRFDTILRVSTAIVERQKNFLTHGELAMRPLVLREIADELGMHESTISRVTTAKYMATPQGTFELKYFFGSGLGTDSGSAASSTAVPPDGTLGALSVSPRTASLRSFAAVAGAGAGATSSTLPRNLFGGPAPASNAGARKSYSQALATVPVPSPDAVKAVAPKQRDPSPPVRPAQPAPVLSTASPARASAKRVRKRIRSPRSFPRGPPLPHDTAAACAPAPAKRKCRSDAPNWRARGPTQPKHATDKAGYFSSLVGLIWSVRCALAELSSTPLLSITASKRGLQLVMDQS